MFDIRHNHIISISKGVVNMKRLQTYVISMTIIVGLCCFSACGFAQDDKEMLNKEDMSLEEILEEERAQHHVRLDDFLKDFDEGYVENSEEDFDALLDEKIAIASENEQDAIDTDSFEEFNAAFDKMIEEDLADFDLIDIDTEDLESGLDLKVALSTEQET